MIFYHCSGACGSNRGNAFTIAMVEIEGKLNKTNSNKWISSHISSYDYDVYHSEQYHSGKNHQKERAHYQAHQNQTLITSFRDKKYYVTGTINGQCVATLHVRFFDDLRGI